MPHQAGEVAGPSPGAGPTGASAVVIADPLVIDDFEGSDLLGCPRGSWASDWWIATDGTGTSVHTDKAGLPAVLSEPWAGHRAASTASESVVRSPLILLRQISYRHKRAHQRLAFMT